MTEIFVKEKKIEQVKVILSSVLFNIEQQSAGNDGDQHNIKNLEKKIDEVIRIKSTQDPFKFIAQNNEAKKNTNFVIKRLARNKLKPEIKMYRQGDLLFKKIAALPDHLKEKPDNIVAGGEGNAHTHMLVNGELFQVERSDQKYIRTREDTRLIHEEHLPIKLEPGDYEVVRQREYLGPGLVKRERFVTD